MDIRLAKFNRIRLTRKEFEILKNGSALHENFQFTTDLNIAVTLMCDKLDKTSKLQSTGHAVKISLSEADLQALDNNDPKTDLTIENFCLQVDLWSEEFRTKRENKNGT